MVELCICAIDQNNADFYLNCMRYKRGDVIEAMPDGTLTAGGWGAAVVANPNWVILGMPAETVQTAGPLLSFEPPVDPLNPSKTLQRRGFRLNLDDPRVQALIISGTTDPLGLNPITLPAKGSNPPTPSLADLTVQKPAISDPAVIGQPASIIGP